MLDVACGPGILSAAIAKSARAVVAFDLTPGMLKKAEQRCSEAGLAMSASVEGNAAELPFADGAFDAVVTRLSVHHFDRPGRVMSEIFRVLRPGGRLVVADVISSEESAKSELQNAIEILRDPSHVQMLPGSELDDAREGCRLRHRIRWTSWDKPREFEEWMGIVNDASRVAPLRAVVQAPGERRRVGRHRTCARRQEDQGFFHRWNLIASRAKPADRFERYLTPPRTISRTCPTISSIMAARHIEMGAGADAAVHHREQHAALVQGRHHLCRRGRRRRRA